MSGGTSRAPRRSHARLETIALVGIALVGAVLRIRQWLEARSMWHDEVALAVNFAQKGFPAILTEQLMHQQSAPPGFLFATQAATRVFGFDERALRLAALLAGLATVAVAVIVARRLLAHPVARIAFVALVALSPALVYYSNELKQYSTDVLALMVVLALWSLRDHPRRVPLLAIGGFLIAIFSLVGIIALLAFGVAFAIEYLSHRFGDRARTDADPPQPAESRRQGAVVAGAWAAGIALHGWYTLRSGTDRAFMQTWWGDRGAFPPESIGSIGELEWYPLSIMRLIWIGIGEEARIGARGATGSALATVIVIALIVVMLRTRPDLRSLVLGIFAFAWVLAEVRIYPTSGRLSLYVIPIVFMGIAAGLDSTLQMQRATRSILAIGGVGFLIFVQASISISYLVEPLNDRDMKWIANELEQRSDHTDAVIVSPGHSGKIADWYRVPSLIQPGNYFVANDIASLTDDIVRGEQERVWVTSTHLFPDARERVAELTEIGYQAICVEEFRATYLALLLRSDLAAEADTEELCRLANPY